MGGDSFENFVRSNREEFDRAVPSLKVWAQIDQQMAKRKSKRIVMYRVVGIAASIVLLLGMGTAIGGYLANNQDTNAMNSIANISPEYSEIEQYYSEQIQDKYQQLTSLQPDEAVFNDLEQVDVLMEELKKELGDAPKGKEEQIVEALIQSYQTKIEILERVLERIQSTNQETIKTEKNETII